MPSWRPQTRRDSRSASLGRSLVTPMPPLSMYSRLPSFQRGHATGRRPTCMASSVAKVSGSAYDILLAMLRSHLDASTSMPALARGLGRRPTGPTPSTRTCGSTRQRREISSGRSAASWTAKAAPREVPTRVTRRPISCSTKAARCLHLAAAEKSRTPSRLVKPQPSRSTATTSTPWSSSRGTRRRHSRHEESKPCSRSTGSLASPPPGVR
mmetsp:Transcript_3701/g.10956  ORF Transcript_3701/g.10956 Transcript_3701/m.10956 type:complete len:211 (-) Transcript_3701:315-947(-)